VPAPLVPARLAYAADGTPWSEAYADVYHSAARGPAQARHVFLRGNDLPARWSARARFTVLELGFGFGLSFLATWQAWREHGSRCARLHYVSVEKHPFARHDAQQLHARYPEFASLAARLQAAWPMLVPGVQRIEFEGGRIVLTLALGDVAEVLPQLRLAADAVYLDGFAPARNPEMWTPATMRQIARRCAAGATAATWSAAGAVRQALREAGFEVERHPGFERKRDMLRARLVAPGRDLARAPERRAIVVGAGIAGAAVTERLCARDWNVTLLERQPKPIPPGRHSGVFHPVATPDDSLFARLTRAGFLAALGRWRALEAAGHAPVWDECGVLQLAREPREAEAQQKAVAALALPPEYVQCVTREEASAHAGVALAAGGLWFPSGGWIRPVSLVAAQLAGAREGVTARFDCTVASIAGRGESWSACDANGRELAAAPVLVLANAADAPRLFPSASLRVRRVRGQITFLPQARFAPPRVVVLRGGFVLPACHGESITGASYDFDDEESLPRVSSHAGNLERLARIVPETGAALDPEVLEGLVGFRAVTADRLPVVGPMGLETAEPPANLRLGRLPRVPGLYGAFALGSRGLLWASLGAELLASLLEGEPLPLEARLAEALDPGRFFLRALRRRPAARL
jgi:tRNA 5-methylaminomethyl-2-thiouridine biosynthesis bifunctional protein